MQFPDMVEDIELDDRTLGLIAALSSGGDARITLDPVSGLNRYFSAPYPRRTLAYASSTANDLSRPAFEHLLATLAEGNGDYSAHLDRLRGRIRAAYGLDDSVEVAFAPSGTDLEYVALAAVEGKAPGGTHNILLGADEVGSGCIHSAHARYFADETALGCATVPASPVGGFSPVSLSDVPVRCGGGLARSSADIAAAIADEIELAHGQGKHALVHVVHGSKTGLILPEAEELDYLENRFGPGFDLVIDACQARITTEAVHAYLARGAMVFLTGSKFMGGPPFNGFALLPASMVSEAAPLPEGLANIFRRAEFPQAWAGRHILPDSENHSLALRFEASIFELERFQSLGMDKVRQVIGAFSSAVRSELLEPLQLSLVKPHIPGAREELREHPIEMQTLATLDVSSLPGLRSFADAQRVHRDLALSGLRLGQPVKSVRVDGEWGGTMRIGLSMPQFSAWAGLRAHELERQLQGDMAAIAEHLTLQTA